MDEEEVTNESIQENEEKFKKRRLAGKQELVSLDTLQDKFDATWSLDKWNWGFDFVEPPAFQQVIKVVNRMKTVFEETDQPSSDSTFHVPVIDGASGSGKSRLGWEVGLHFKREHGAQFVFLDCSAERTYDTKEERVPTSCANALAKVLFKRFVKTDRRVQYQYTLDEVLARIKQDTGSRLVVIQVDQYSQGQVLARMVVRACRNLFHYGKKRHPGVVVLPILSGITYSTIRRDFLEFSERLLPVFFSRRGVEDVDKLIQSVMKYLNLSKVPRNLELIMATFSGFPRLFVFLDEAIDWTDLMEDLEEGELDRENAQKLYDQVLETYKAKHGSFLWSGTIQANVSKEQAANVSALTNDCIRRIQTFAITGDSVSLAQEVVPGLGVTLSDMSPCGLFSLVTDNDQLSGKVFMPLIAIDACRYQTGIVGTEMLSPFSNTWMEAVAMCTLVCRWNTLFYKNNGKPVTVVVDYLRPGSRWNRSFALPQVTIDQEFGCLEQLREPFKGNLDTTFNHHQFSAAGVKIKDRTAYLILADESGNDGLALFQPVAWLNQSKKLEMSADAVQELVKKQKGVLDEFDFGSVVTSFVFELFTNRPASLAESDIPPGVLVTTKENFERVVGPLFATSKTLFD